LVATAQQDSSDERRDWPAHLPHIAHELAESARHARMDSLLDLDAGRVIQWTFVRCVKESVDAPWLRPIANAFAPS
jgi:hypothetical protein